MVLVKGEWVEGRDVEDFEEKRGGRRSGVLGIHIVSMGH